MFCVLTTTLFFLLGHCRCQCTNRNSCERRTDGILPGCYCDDDCPIYKDCCLDYVTSRRVRSNNTSPLDSSNHDNFMLDQTCTILTDSTRNVANRVGAFMVDKCLATGKKCLVEDGKIETMLPVSNGNTTYRNGQCAICNGVSDFDPWSIVYNIVDEKDALSFSPSGESINDDNVLELLKYDNMSAINYVLYPPTNHVTRFCPYGIVSSLDKNESVDSIPSHQNVVECKGTLYKNIDICEKNICCPTRKMICVDFIIPFSADISANSRANKVEGGLRILLKYEAEEITKTSKVLKVLPQITYSNQPAPIVLKIRQLENKSFNLNECVHGIIVYLQYTIFKLFPEHFEYRYATDGSNMYIVFIGFREMAKLDESNINRLIGLEQHITFEKKVKGLEDVIATAELRVLESNGTAFSVFGNLLKELEKATILQGYVKPKTSKTHPPCSNVSIIISKTGMGYIADAICLDKKLNLKVSGANVNQESVKVGLLVMIIVSLFQY